MVRFIYLFGKESFWKFVSARTLKDQQALKHYKIMISLIFDKDKKSQCL